MAKAIPDEYTNVLDGNGQAKADGRVINAGLRNSRLSMATASESVTTSDTISLGYLHAGDCLRAVEITASTNMAAASVAIGKAGSPAFFLPAAALPNATSQRRKVARASGGFAPLEKETEVIVTISGATIPAGDLTFDLEFTRR